MPGKGLVLYVGKKPQMRRPRKDAWTKRLRAAFLDELSATCNIAASLRRVRKNRRGLDKLRARDASFRAEMRAAIRRAYTTLELFALEQIMNGTVKTTTKADGSVEKVHHYPLHLALNLLRLHKATADEPEEAPDDEAAEAVRRRILRKLTAVRAEIEAEEAAARGADCAEAGQDPGDEARERDR